MDQNFPFHVELLRTELKKRQEKNPRYSLRAFAAYLEVHPSALSRIFALKQEVSLDSSVKITKKLKLEQEVERLFLCSVIEERKKNYQREIGEKVLIPNLRKIAARISSSDYEKIADIHCITVLELSALNHFESNFDWIASQLKIEKSKVEEAVTHLVELGLLEWQDGKLVRKSDHFCAIDEVATSETRRRHQRQILEQAIKSLEDTPIERRWNSGMMMAVDPKKLPEAKQRIWRFMEDLCDFLECGERTHLYQLGIQLFPMTQAESNNSAADTPSTIV